MVEPRVRRRGEISEREEVRDVVGIEDAESSVLLHLEEDLEEGLFREEEESETRRVGVRIRGGGDDGDRGDGDRDVAGVCESEFLEEDHGAGVVGDYEGFDLGCGRWDRGEERDGEEEDGDCRGHFRHCCG